MIDKKYFRAGVIFLITSVLIGYAGLSAFIMLYLWTDHPFWAWAGSGIYIFSWLIFGLGFILSGKEGLKIIKTTLYKTK